MIYRKSIQFFNKLLFLIAFFFILLVTNFTTYAVAPTYNLTETPSPKEYNAKYSGFTDIGWSTVSLVDLNDNDRADLVMFAQPSGGYGGLRIIYDDLLQTSGFGNTLTNYTAHIFSTNSAVYGYLGMNFNVADVTNDGLVDLILSAAYADFNSRTNSGSVFIIPNEVFSNITGQTNSINITDPNVWTTRIDGANAYDSLQKISVGDYDGDNLNDLALCSPFTDYNSRSQSGSCYIINNSKISQSATYGTNTLDLNSATNYDVRFDGVSSGGVYGTGNSYFADFDGDGDTDLTIGHNWATYSGKTNPGSVFIIKNDKIVATNPTKSVDLNTSTSYNIRYIGGNSEYLSEGFGGPPDLDQNSTSELFLTAQSYIYYISDELLGEIVDGEGQVVDLSISSTYYTARMTQAVSGADLVATAADYSNSGTLLIPLIDQVTDYSGTDFGSSYFIPSNIFTSYTGTGNTYAVTDINAYLYRFDGGGLYTVSLRRNNGDIDGDGTLDFVYISYNAKTVWIVYNFPHTITTDAITSPTNASPIVVTGNVIASDSVSDINGVQYNFEDNEEDSENWQECTASDSDFDSKDEDFTCSITGLTDGSNTIYFRSYDDNGTYTGQAFYSTESTTFDTSSPSELKLSVSAGDKKYTAGDKDITIDERVFKMYFDTSDGTTGVNQIMISQDNDFNGASWKDYDGDIQFKFKKDGKKNIYLKFKDSAGNESDVFKQIVKVDTSGPELEITNVGGIDIDLDKYKNYFYTETNPIIRGTSEKDSDVKIYVDNNKVGEYTNVDEDELWEVGLTLDVARHGVKVVSTDKAGNSTELEFNLTIDPSQNLFPESLRDGEVSDVKGVETQIESAENQPAEQTTQIVTEEQPKKRTFWQKLFGN